MTRHLSRCLPLVASLCLPGGAAGVEQGGVEFSGSGFLTVAAGRVFGGDPAQDFNGYRAPMFVTDYAQGGIYENRGWTLKSDSKLGLQGTASFGPKFSATGQVVSRGVNEGRFNLEWAYGNYAIDDKLTFQFGRKRLPLFYYSETQDVGLANPWVHLPSGQYGWEIVNYNGANLLYRDQWAAWSSSMNFFAGSETRRDNEFWKIYNGRATRTDSKWSNIVGADMALTKGVLEARAAYVQSNMQDRFEDPTASPPYDYSPQAKQRIYSLSFSVDARRWVVRNEYLYIDRKPIGEEDFSFLLGVGYRLDKYLPMITYNRYKMRLNAANADASVIDPSTIDPASAEGWSTLVLSLRYDLTATSALKAQLERWKDLNGPAFNGGVAYGNARLFSVSYDLVF
jgi:hypothetical protein